MPIETVHPSYNDKIHRWLKQRDAYMGEDSIKLNPEVYLSRPEGFRETHWERYFKRAKWYGATRRTVSGLTGAVFQKDARIESSNAALTHMQNITLNGISMMSFSHNLFRELLLLGRYGILVDYSDEMQRPFWAGYPAEAITNWRTELREGRVVLSMVVLIEETELHFEDRFQRNLRNRWRCCFLNDEGNYQVDIYEQNDAFQAQTERGNPATVVESFIPLRRGQPLDFIPFQFFGVENLTSDVATGILDDLTDINYAYFRHSADYEHGLFLTGLPTPVVTGHSDTDDLLAIGGLTAWVFPNPDAKAYFLEYQGMGLESHERAMANDKVEMATLGARLLEEAPQVAETLGAVALRHTGDTASLKDLARLASDGLSSVLRWHEWWAGSSEATDDERFSMALNTDFSSARLSAQDLQALMLAWQGGAISQETLLHNLSQGEILPPGVSPEDEMRRIETAAPSRLPFGDDDESETSAA